MESPYDSLSYFFENVKQFFVKSRIGRKFNIVIIYDKTITIQEQKYEMIIIFSHKKNHTFLT